MLTQVKNIQVTRTAPSLMVFPERVSTFTANRQMFDAMDYVIRPLAPAA